MKRKEFIAVAMSGGIDSAVAAGILAQQGNRIIGVYLDLWKGSGEKEENNNQKEIAIENIKTIAEMFNFPFKVIQAKTKFKESIVKYFINAISQGITPNPCVLCNKIMKFDFLFKKVQKLGVTKIATGHYVRKAILKSGRFSLRKGADKNKDQSYYLCLLSQEQLRIAMFPLSNKQKPEVLNQAKQFGLNIKEIKESQDLCFLEGKDYREFIKKYAPYILKRGDIVNEEGKIIGSHEGLGLYTIGQRKGIGVYSTRPIYVIKKDVLKNRLIVSKNIHLGRNNFEVKDINWITRKKGKKPFYADVKIRYRAKPVRATIKPITENSVFVRLDKQLRDITPGQFAVFYHKDIVLGGGIIKI